MLIGWDATAAPRTEVELEEMGSGHTPWEVGQVGFGVRGVTGRVKDEAKAFGQSKQKNGVDIYLRGES